MIAGFCGVSTSAHPRPVDDRIMLCVRKNIPTVAARTAAAAALIPHGAATVHAHDYHPDLRRLPPHDRPHPATRKRRGGRVLIQQPKAERDTQQLKWHDRRLPNLAERHDDEMRSGRPERSKHHVAQQRGAHDHLAIRPAETRGFILNNREDAKGDAGADDDHFHVDAIDDRECLVVKPERGNAEHAADHHVVEVRREMLERSLGIGAERERGQLPCCGRYETQARMPPDQMDTVEHLHERTAGIAYTRLQYRNPKVAKITAATAATATSIDPSVAISR